MKTVLITGCNGLLGQKLVSIFLKDSNIKLIATARGDNRMMHKSGYIYESIDITNNEEIKRIIHTYYPDTIINTAALTSADYCEANHDDCSMINIQAVKNLVQEANHIYAQLIHLSTDFVFSGDKGRYNESDEPGPVNYYGWSKRESEKIVEELSERWSIVRTSLVYGVYDNPTRTNLPLLVKSYLEKKKVIRVNNDQFRTPTLAEDLASGISEIAHRDSEGYYNISGAEYISILETANLVADFFNLDRSLILPVSSIELNENAKRPLKGGLKIDRAIKELDYSPCKLVKGLEKIKRQLSISGTQ